MTAAAPRFARADAYARARRNRSALALAIGVHLLGAWFWLQQRPARTPRAADAPGVVTILLRKADGARAPAPSPASPTMPSPPSTPRTPRLPRQLPRAAPATSDAGEHAPAVRQPDLPPVYVPPSEPAPAAPSSGVPGAPSAPTTSDSAQASMPDATAAPGYGDSTDSPAPAPADGGFTASLGRRQAGRIDRELRAGKAGVPTEADTPWARFQRGLEAAHVERSMSAHLDSYTSPDGVVIYRRRVGSRTQCYQTGSVGLGVAGTRTGGNAGNVQCPSGVTWKREE